jgi:uncharacterized protein (TIGR00730 family)
MNITVYLGANPGSDPALKAAVRELGHWIGECGHTLVYGGSKSGLMGELAQSVLRSGGEVTGVEPRFFVDAGFVYDAITQLIVTEDMAQRKAKMIELGDAFIAFPGGTGTLEEIAESLAHCNLGLIAGKCVFLNINGYYEPMRTMLDAMVQAGYMAAHERANAVFADSVEELEEYLK